mmetsp:Transcript_709/g.2523  ORF Transcript_709/g.2523 Transcript_709/m.2523 type:complete len:239 (+) Transcript_709:98-814(+)
MTSPRAPAAFIKRVFDHNRAWAAQKHKADPAFFKRLADGQKPTMMWLGCSDSRVPAAQLLGLGPGEVFVHRNVANVLHHSDLNCLSVLQYAVEALKVKHIVVCGHYGCGGIQAAMQPVQHGLVDNWIRSVRDQYADNLEVIQKETDPKRQWDLMCELNTKRQVLNVAHTTIVQNAWQNNEELSVHGWIYDPADGILDDLGVTVSGMDCVGHAFRTDTPVHLQKRDRTGEMQDFNTSTA